MGSRQKVRLRGRRSCKLDSQGRACRQSLVGVACVGTRCDVAGTLERTHLLQAADMLDAAPACSCLYLLCKETVYRVRPSQQHHNCNRFKNTNLLALWCTEYVNVPCAGSRREPCRCTCMHATLDTTVSFHSTRHKTTNAAVCYHSH